MTTRQKDVGFSYRKNRSDRRINELVRVECERSGQVDFPDTCPVKFPHNIDCGGSQRNIRFHAKSEVSAWPTTNTPKRAGRRMVETTGVKHVAKTSPG